MAGPMRDSSLDGSHRPRVADSRTTAKPDSANFEYDDNEWDIGIGDLIIDLDADIEKTNEGAAAGSMASTAPGPGASAKKALAIEHSATVDKGLKMKIKRTKPGTKTSEAKHEIVKSNQEQQQGGAAAAVAAAGGGQQQAATGGGGGATTANTPNTAVSAQQNGAMDITTTGSGGSPAGGTTDSKGKHVAGGPGGTGGAPPPGQAKRGSSGHRRDKARDKHGGAGGGSGGDKPSPSPKPAAAAVQPERPTTPQQQRAAFPAAPGPGPPAATAPQPPPPASPSTATAPGAATQPAKPEQTKVASVVLHPSPAHHDDRMATSPPPAKKLKTSNEPKGMLDVCVGTSVGTITEPDCLGPCEPGTSVTLEGIVWHETEGGVLVVNVTWRGKTYVGTLLDCTRHDWAPPRFCDSPTSDLDARTPKGRGKRGRAAASATPGNDLSNFTETRSSVHSKLRNGGGKGRRGGATGGSGSGAAAAGTASPTPFIPPRPEPSSKRKSRAGEEDTPAPAATAGKKSRVASAPTTPAAAASSPPASPVLLECPEPNCSKKYKHINGLKYHQSHAHGSADDDDTKDVTSMSENDESNIEAPSPATPVKSPEKALEAPATPQKKEEVAVVAEVVSAPSTPPSPVVPTPAEPATPQPIVTPQPLPLPITPQPQQQQPIPLVPEPKSVVKPGVLRFGPQEDFSTVGVGAFAGNKPPTSSVSLPNSGNSLTTVRAVSVSIAPSQPQDNTMATFTNQLSAQVTMSTQQQVTMTTQQQVPLQAQSAPLQAHQQPLHSALAAHQNHQPNPAQAPVQVQVQGQPQQQPQAKLPQFKVKPTAALMPDDKKVVDRNKPQNYKKKSRKSPAGSPHPHPQPEQPVFVDQAGREEVQSPAYSDISDDAAPVDTDVADKNKNAADKKTEPGQTMPHSMPQYGMYPFYGQPPYLVPSVQQQVQDGKPKEGDKVSVDKSTDKDPKKDGPEYPQKMLPQHYYSYPYVSGYPYNMEPSYGAVSMVPEEKLKEERIKESPSPAEHNNKPAAPIPNPIQVPTPGKVKTEPPPIKEKHQNENHQILKESIEMKSQMSPYMYSRQPQQQPAHVNHHHHAQAQQQQGGGHAQREEEMRRYYLYPEQQRRKEPQQEPPQQKTQTPNKVPPQSPSVKHKDKVPEEKKDKEVKQEGVKPTMETQGPPPPPTSQYAYAIHPSYMQSPHYGALPFDPNHPMYRSMLVPGPYSGSPYLHPQIPRYHAPEDLSRPPQGPTKALDLLQHHANQYYTSHKIHELQERAMKSPTPKTSVASASPSSGAGGGTGGSGPPSSVANAPATSQAAVISSNAGGKQAATDNKESRSPPPQRHVHTHHHTHVGLGYPLYAPPYGAAVLASQQAAAVTVINPYPPK